MDIRIGNGFDVHQFAENRKCVIGGVDIPYERGLLGHSDADVLLHAVCDALLGALALGDIGMHFPDTDQKYKNADSKILLKNVYGLIKDRGYEVVNLDCSLLLQKPKIAKYVPEMRRIIAGLIETSEDRVSVKATTTEKLGFVGREEGAAAMASVLIKKKGD